MISALFSFLGGSAFRMIWGQVADYVEKRQNHQHEIEMLELQADMDKVRHSMDIDRLKVSSELGIKEVVIKADAEVDKLDAEAFMQAMKAANQKTGIIFVDAWNGIIRPMAASIAIILWVAALHRVGYVMSEWDKELVAVVLGFFFASRVLVRERNK